ncbi:MAG: diacylglycerol kinase family lipid kinase [Armatimonadetes bacterium]|nr:diacylglycerol kinase family lipid kinase [Armatimonadota bacterium]
MKEAIPIADSGNAFLIMNPAAGQKLLADPRAQVESACRECGLKCEIALTERPGHGTQLAREAVSSGHALVVAAGGDGTVNEVVAGMVGADVSLGIIPIGTVNVLARQFGIPMKVRPAVETLASGKVRRIDIGRSNDRYFTLMAGFGFDAEVVAGVLRPLKDVIGASAYVLKGLEMLSRYEATDLTLEMPNETYSCRAYLVVVANSPTYAYKLRLAPYASTEDGLFDVIVFEEQSSSKQIGFAHQIVDVLIRTHVHNPAVKYFKTPTVTVRSHPDVMVQLDGDACGVTPAEVLILPQALPLIVP